MAVDAWGFDSDRQAKAHRLRRDRFRFSLARTGALVALTIGLVTVGSVALRDAVLSLRWPSWASSPLFLVILFAAFFAVELPFAYLGGHRLETASGLSSQSFGGWMKDLGKTAGLGLGASIVVGGILLWLLSTLPTSWWLVAWLLGILVSAVLGFLAPVLLVPLFYRFRPLADPVLRRRFEALAAKAGVPILGVFELRASVKTRRSNAAVMGLGRTRRVIVTDTLVSGFTPDEVETVLAHELAHQKYRDPIRGFLSGSLVSLLLLFVASWIYSLTYSTVGIRTPADLAGLPLLAAIFSLLALPFRPLELRASRSREARADRFSLALTGDPANFIAAMVKLHDLNLGVADPRPWEKWLFYSHPTGRDRVEMARAFHVSSA
jgi:STE24 endopeptidase